MKITNIANGWTVEGMFITFFPAHLPISEPDMQAYFDLRPGMDQYAELSAPARVNRYVLMKPTGIFVVVPINSNTHVEKTE